ncbi:steroidogenic acute regulatory protein, mitochondrial [Astyanax mexicanus]|uniref:steroidogenic acute regulatory protein, mitochondrial n=1 Tax=Astyanax mexicanus TaxID=7994 RepID=UPI0020CA9F76|nr:steroidogenic acute regulatory protein, mitochondrial [Astyanax mexicanus]
MLPAVAKLCCGISYPHLRSMTGLQRVAVAALGQEIAHRHQTGQIPIPAWASCVRWSWGNNSEEVERGKGQRDRVNKTDLSYQHQGQQALQTALEIVQDAEGWRMEMSEESGDTIYSKVLHGNRKVFRLEAELEASPEELYDILFVKVEEMHQWNPSIRHIKILKHVGQETKITHEVSAETVGNLIGQRDFLSVRHSLKMQNCIYLGGAATHLESFPPHPEFVRAEDGPTCIIIRPSPNGTGKSRFTWLLNMDVKGWIPKSLVNQALPRAQVDFTAHLRRRLAAGGKKTAAAADTRP